MKIIISIDTEETGRSYGIETDGDQIESRLLADDPVLHYYIKLGKAKGNTLEYKEYDWRIK